MPIDLTKSLAWKQASAEELKLLENLQGNILKGHGRHFTANLFLKFGADKAVSRRLLRELANYHLTSAHRQLLDAEKFKKEKDGGGAFCHLALSFAGYKALGLQAKAPQDGDFTKGMSHKDSLHDLSDPPVAKWDPEFPAEPHAMLLCAHDSESETAALAREMRKLAEEAGCSVWIQHGKALFNAKRDGIEHFGYVDGRSQPLMLEEDIDEEAAKAGIANWNPTFGLDIALIEDPGVVDKDHPKESCGSFFVFRKLEQNVQEFKHREQLIADAMHLKGEARELVGALLVGRFENGTPVTMAGEAVDREPLNDFNYEGDSGTRCPLHAHIRKTNPRGTGGQEKEPQERKHLMPRRGIPYEDVKRKVHPNELAEADTLDEFKASVLPNLPTGGVGLLFMAYNASIGLQFKVAQQAWANDTGFPKKPPGPHGIDPVIGQGPNKPGDQKLPSKWDDPTAPTPHSFSGHVTMKGGEYFFSPSLRFLKTM